MEKNRFWVAFMSVLAVFFFFFVLAVNGESDLRKKYLSERRATKDSHGRVIPVLEIVRFPNDACNSTGNMVGTCYTVEECESLGGTNGGSCAQGFGVCCTFSVTCGGTTSQNCTIFESGPEQVGESCKAEICPCSDNICQLRLDFMEFMITGPSVDSTPNSQSIGGAANSVLGDDVNTIGLQPRSDRTQCDVDQFTVTSPGNTAPPIICGMNMGEHMYVEAGGCLCNQLGFNLGQTVGGNAVNREWRIKVTQYSCDFCNLAPEGCTKYFFGNVDADERILQTYNFGGGSHLANQREKFCIRRERGTCRVCYVPAENMAGGGDFDVGESMSGNGVAAFKEMCCGHGLVGSANGFGWDCIVIPGAEKKVGNAFTLAKFDEFCGGGKGAKKSGFFLGTSLTSMSVIQAGGSETVFSICTNKIPFQLAFYSDNGEIQAENNPGPNNRGFRVQYELIGC